ncbi:FtsK/SpoIIIE domain-containing protein [Streptomyces sp. NBC_00201]|uniref:FtsK/SpoIIIE domain-containing protein n=1 Tax=Streptomyces sp. NBC_00201 TaxID=2975679 RepID=UPI0022536944|nr:FtsK/SpoIIIE domain-containing protein [Streptomyces sp. NBC_00201]MCX5247844.1 FtsK/SpoIIIE domain-containing protein [Streptomyces sp. NBC_00201]
MPTITQNGEGVGRTKQQGKGEDTYGQAAGAIGGLAIAFGFLATIKDKLGLSWPATVLLTAGGLVALGYLAWRIRWGVPALWARKPATSPAAQPTALQQESPVQAVNEAQAPGEPVSEAQVAVEAASGRDESHPQLTMVLSRVGAIGRGERVRAGDVVIETLPGIGTVYDFLVPEGRTHDDVAKRLGPIASMFGVTRLHLKLETSRKTERRVRLLVLNEPPFSQPFPAPTRQEIQTFAGVPLGHEVTGRLAGVPTFDKASLLVGGMTQMGKTTLVNGLITCLLIAYGDFDLYLLDGKLCGLTRFEKLAVRYEASDAPAVLESMLNELLIRVDDRYTQLQDAIRNRQPAPVFKPVFFIIDEAADFYTDNGTKESKEQVRRVEDKSRSLVAKSLESGIATVMLTQRPARDAIPVKVRDQFLYRLCLYVASEGSAKVALGDSYFDTVAPIHPALLDPDVKGQGVLFANGTSTLLRGFNFSDEFIWGVVDEVHARREAAIPDSPLKQAIGLLRETGVDFMSTPDLAPALGITEDDPAERGKQLNRLLGVPAVKTAQGRGYRLADLTAAAMSGS